MSARERREKLRSAQREKAAAQFEKSPRRRAEEPVPGAEERQTPAAGDGMSKVTSEATPAQVAGAHDSGAKGSSESRPSAAELLPAPDAPPQQVSEPTKTEVETKMAAHPSTKEQPGTLQAPAEVQGTKYEVVAEAAMEMAEDKPSTPDVWEEGSPKERKSSVKMEEWKEDKPSTPDLSEKGVPEVRKSSVTREEGKEDKPSSPDLSEKGVPEAPKSSLRKDEGKEATEKVAPEARRSSVATDDSPSDVVAEDAAQRRARLRFSRRSTLSAQAIPRRPSRTRERAAEADAAASLLRRQGLESAFAESHRALERLLSELDLGVEVDQSSGRSLRLTVSEAQLQQMRAEHLDAFHRRLLKVATASAFDRMASLAVQRSALQDTRKAQWWTSEDFRKEARAHELLLRRGNYVVQHAEDVASRCAQEAGHYVYQLTALEDEVSPEKRMELQSCQKALDEECKSLANSIAAFQSLATSLARPSTDAGQAEATSLLGGSWSEQKLGLQVRFALAADCLQQRRTTVAERAGPKAAQLPLEQELLERLRAEKEAWHRDASSESSWDSAEEPEEQEDWSERVAAAMALLDTHQPKPVKVRVAGLRQSVLGDQDTFKRLVAEKFAEAINIDSEEIRVKNIRGGTPRQ
ncbi:zmpB [Symbiodinium natans]|uniref:ZmpB protein n=1 Tax=Symbiodinium natans TaxID=878477 RepID=A0A812H678_9DINO|nr:zmpB [Symbiodinium natans]